MRAGPRLRRIEWRLPLSIAAVLLVVVAAFSWTAYNEVRQASLEAAGERLNQVAGQFAGLYEQSVENRIADLRSVAGEAAVRAALASPTEARLSRARPGLERYVEASAQTEAVRLWDAAGRLVLDVPRPGSEVAADPAPVFPEWAPGARAASDLGSSGDAVWFEVVAPVGDESAPAGYLVERRRVTASSQQAARTLRDLIGMDARLLVGTPGGIWTDLERVVPQPGAPGPEATAVADGAGPGGRFHDYEVPGLGRRLGIGRPVAGTSWQAWVDFPESLVLARSRAFLGRMLLVGLLVVLGGAVLGWVLSRRVTIRLKGIAKAATALAEGDYARRVPPGRPDELGELAGAFNVMAARVEDAHHRLEERVRERTEELRRYAADLNVANRELEAFCYSVSHDLRAPLRAIHGFSQALLEDSDADLDASGREHLYRVCAAADRMGALIDDLLHLSRVARADVSAAEVDLSAMAEDVLRHLRAEEPERSVDARVQPDLSAFGDTKLLRIALTNLIGNAWKFTGGRPDARVEFGVREEDGEAVYFVRDNGAGFDMAYADKLFGPFQRLHRADEFEGSGIGLATVQRVVHRHGGRIWAEAEPERGAAFYFTLAGHGRAGNGRGGVDA